MRSFQAMVPMRDGVKLNTFVYLPDKDGPRFPVILQRTPYGITSAEGRANHDCAQGWLPAADAPMRGSILRGYRLIVEHGYAAVYQDTRGRYGSEGEDRVYANDAADGYDTLQWIASQPWCNQMIGMSGSSAGATTTFAAASQRHPCLRAFFAQVGGSSIYDDVVYEGNAIEMERLWLWVSKNIPGLSASHRDAVMRSRGVSAVELAQAAAGAAARYARLEAARHARVPFVGSEDWMRLPLTRYPEFSTWQPFLDEIITHPAPDAFRTRHNFRRTIEIPGFHATTWYDIFQTSIIAAFSEIQARAGNQLLWIGPNDHYFIYEKNFWPRDPYFEWFDHWLKGRPTGIMNRPAVHYSPRAWVEERASYVADDWLAGEVRATLNVGSDCPDTDFIVKLIEVPPDGRVMLLMDGVVRAMYGDLAGVNAQPLEPGRVCQLSLSLAHIYHTVRKGHRLEVDVTSSNFPRRARNTNNGHALLANDGEADIRVARNSVHHVAATPSFVEIPVLFPGEYASGENSLACH